MKKNFLRNLNKIQKDLARLKAEYQKREIRPFNNDAVLKSKDKGLKMLKREIDMLEREINELAMRAGR